MGRPVNAVFEGGGVRGIAFVGAIRQTLARDLEFANLAGTSAGAVVASLLAVGYTGERDSELERIMKEAPYASFRDNRAIGNIPIFGHAITEALFEGLYKGDALLAWISGLMPPGKTRFGALKNGDGSYRLHLTASDITHGELLKLPEDIVKYGEDPDQLEIARAVRMSASIPYFFEPVKLKRNGKDAYIVDGGLLSTFPLEYVWEPGRATIGYRLVGPNTGSPNTILGPITFAVALISTMLTAHDNFYIEERKFVDTVAIKAFERINGRDVPVDAVKFDLTQGERDLLFNHGVAAADEFFKNWDYDESVRRATLGKQGNLPEPERGARLRSQ